MTELSSEINPQILVNGGHQHQQDDAATVQEQIPTVSLDTECSKDSAAEKEAQAKMQSLLQQVRNQVRLQAGKKAPKSSIMELVQRVKDREMEIAQVSADPDGKDVNSAEQQNGELFTDENEDDVHLKEEELCAVFEEKLEASKKVLRDEFEVQISQMRKEMQAYTDHALKDLECKMQSWKSHCQQQTHPKEQQESKCTDKKQKPSAAPSLATRRGRVLTRTMTAILPKTCAPVIIGPRARSETLTSAKGESSRLLPRDPAFYIPGNKPYQSHKPLPPACRPLHQRKKHVQAKTGN